jgi:hypothetical protein
MSYIPESANDIEIKTLKIVFEEHSVKYDAAYVQHTFTIIMRDISASLHFLKVSFEITRNE